MTFTPPRTFPQEIARLGASPLVWALAALWILLGGMEASSPRYFLHDDNATQFVGFFVHDYRVLTETGRLAEVDYYQYGGEPFLEQGQTAVLYPPVYAAVGLAKWISGDLRWTIEWLIAGHLTLGLLGFYSWLRNYGVTSLHAALGGLAWVLNPFVIIMASSWVNVSFVACYLPWLFWALDRLWHRPSAGAGVRLGAILGLYFLQGWVQWVAYSLFFLGLYAGLRFCARTEMSRAAIIKYGALSIAVSLALCVPLLLPMLHAMSASVTRSHPFGMVQALTFSVSKSDLFPAQVFCFKPGMIFYDSTAILYCPALLLFPLMLWRFARGEADLRHKLFPLLILSVLAVFFSSRWHVLLTLLPIFDRFRWPFKVFIFADFFLLAGAVLSLSSYSSGGNPSSWKLRASIGTAGLALLVVLNLAVSLICHEGNFLSRATLPVAHAALPFTLDGRLGRVVALVQHRPDTESYRFLTYAHGTFFEVPTLGGYNPLVSRDQRDFALGIDFPNVFPGPLTPEIRAQLEARAARYWIVETGSPEAAAAASFAGVNLILFEPDRLIFEDTLASPIVSTPAAPDLSYDIMYAGNSILIPLKQASVSVAVSVGPTDGWWYRVDQGPWLRPAYIDNHVLVDPPPGSRQLELSYFDPRFRQGLWWSLGLVVGMGLLAALSWRPKNLAAPTDGS